MVQFILTAAYCAAIGIDFLPRCKAGLNRECVVYAVMILVSYVILMLRAADVFIPSPMLPLQNLIEQFLN